MSKSGALHPMYRINEESNEIERVEAKSFSELGYHERENLQEWIAKNPYVFGEDLLIVQKEFNGFADTNERLDLLALDKAGNTVVIENKLDDSGRDVVWQALKYASYCSQLTKANIRDIYQDYLKTTGATVPGRSNATASTSTATWLSIASSCRKKTGTRRR